MGKNNTCEVHAVCPRCEGTFTRAELWVVRGYARASSTRAPKSAAAILPRAHWHCGRPRPAHRCPKRVARGFVANCSSRLSGVPTAAANLAVGVVLNLLFEICLRSEKGGSGVGRASPVLVVLEEAHRYLGVGASNLTRESANRIAREGRKYGIGLILVTQRPTELPDTALAQCGTLIALRLARNPSDQGAIRAALPDTVAGLAAVLPSLRTGEAIVSGEAVVLPARALLTKPDPEPHAEDPSLDPWRGEPKSPDLASSVEQWRGTYEGDNV